MSEELASNVSFHAWSLNEAAGKNQSTESSLPNINFHVIKYSDKSTYVWIGDASGKLENMSCALKTPYERDPLGVDILLASTAEQNDKSDVSRDLSIKLAKRLNKQVIVSFNVASSLLDQFALQSRPVDFDSVSSDINNNMTLMQLIERRLFSEMKNNADKF